MAEQVRYRNSTMRQSLVTCKELPLCCPSPQSELWNSHPRVYLPIEKTGQEMCPYCGTLYILEGYSQKT